MRQVLTTAHVQYTRLRHSIRQCCRGAAVLLIVLQLQPPLLFLLPLCTHDRRRGDKQLSGFRQLCGLEHIKTHGVLEHGLHVVYPSLSWATFCPSPTAACSIRTEGRLFSWQSHQMTKPLHSLDL